MLSSRFVSSAALLLALAWVLPGTAEAADVQVTLTVSHASSQKGPMEQPNLLPPGFNFQSHRVLQSETLNLGLNEQASHRLPNGKRVRLRPTQKQGNQLSMAVEVEGATKSDLRMRNGKRVTIRHPEPYQGGNLLVHLEARF